MWRTLISSWCKVTKKICCIRKNIGQSWIYRRKFSFGWFNLSKFKLGCNLISRQWFLNRKSQSQLFNKRLSFKRVVVNNAFGLLESCFRRLPDLSNRDLQLCSKIILSCIILHTLCLRDWYSTLDDDELDNNQPLTQSYYNNMSTSMKQHSYRQTQVFHKMFH